MSVFSSNSANNLDFDFNALMNSFSRGQQLLNPSQTLSSAGSSLPNTTSMPSTNFAGSTNSNMNSGLGDAFGENGWAGTALQSILGLGSLFMANRNFGEQRRMNNASIDALKTNLFNQAQTVNSRQYQQQRELNYYNPGLHQNAEDYMRQWGVSGTLGQTKPSDNGMG